MHKSDLVNKMWIFIDRCVLLLQMMLKINRYKNYDFQWSYGSEWFSITNRLANYFVSNEEKIKSRCKWVNCCDGLVLQTLIKNLEFYKCLYGNEPEFSNLWYINWGQSTAHPNTMSKEDI